MATPAASVDSPLSRRLRQAPTPQPARQLRRRTALVLTATAGLLLALSACTPNGSATPDPDTSSAPPSGPTSTPTSTPAPTPAPTAAGISIPTDCRDLVSAETYASTFEGFPLNDPAVVDHDPSGVLQPTPPPPGASVEDVLASAAQLDCVWRQPSADITHLQATLATVDPVIATQYLDSLPAKDFTCEDRYQGRWCQLVTLNDMYQVPEAYTYFLRDDVYLFVGQANFATDGLIAEIADTLWG